MLIGAAMSLAGCGSGSVPATQSSRELALERSQFEQVARQLSALQGPVKQEASASRSAWPAIADGLPATLGSGLRTAVSAANVRAKALAEPAFLANASRLTGPASGIAGIYENYEQLAQRGWSMTEAAVMLIGNLGATVSDSTAAVANAGTARPAGATTNATQANFARANSPLYIDAIYDAHFDLSVLGKRLSEGYKKLGGSRAFGTVLTQAQVNALAEVYSIPAVRLQPHPAEAAKDG
jgi:hypothetical protein